MILQARRPQSPSLQNTDEEVPSRTCSPPKLSHSNGIIVLDDDENSSSEMQQTSRQSMTLWHLCFFQKEASSCVILPLMFVFQENGRGSQEALCALCGRSLTLLRPQTCTWSQTHQAALTFWTCTLHRFRAQVTLFVRRENSNSSNNSGN